MVRELETVDRLAGDQQPIFIIAEIGMNHDGSLGNAKRMVDIAAECGVDAVKFQTHISKAETLRDAPMPPYFKGEPRYQYFERTAFSKAQWVQLKGYSEEKGLVFMSSPFSIEAIELLEEIGVTIHKVPSGEVTNIPYLECMAKTGKKILLSSGMSSWVELDEAVQTIRQYNNNLVILQCTSEYPCPYANVGLNVMLEMKQRYGLPVGFSDHTLTNYTALAAVVLGAAVVEKHFTLSKKMYGSDARHSLEPHELKDLVTGIKAIEVASHSSVDKNDIEKFTYMKKTFEKSIVTIRPIRKGEILTAGNIGIKKPGTGIPAREYHTVLGKRAKVDIVQDVLLNKENIE